MMSRERRKGEDRLTPTSVHLTCASLDTIKEIGRVQSEYIREAVEEKIERDVGFANEIERLRTKRFALETEVENIGHQLDDLRSKNNIFRVDKEKDRVRNLTIELYVDETHVSLADLFLAVRNKLGDPDLGLFGNVGTYDEFVQNLVKEVWDKVVIKNDIN